MEKHNNINNNYLSLENENLRLKKEILEMELKLNISKMTITNINKEIDFNKLFKEKLKTNTEKIMVQTPYLYAGVNSSLSNLTKYRKIEKNMFRTAYFHTGYD